MFAYTNHGDSPMKKQHRDILHVDMNAFFAAVEQHDNPDLKGKPVIVCGDPEKRSVVSTASYEARAYGVKSGMPVTQARRLCPQGVFIRGNIAKYVDISMRIVDIFKSFTPLVEPFSIDEAFLDVTGCDVLFGSPVEIAKQIKKKLRERFDLRCSIGIAPNKLLAKMASDMQKPDGLVVLTYEDVPTKIWPLPVRDLVGVGESTEKALHRMSIKTIGELAKYPLRSLERRFGVVGRALHLAALGMDDSPVQAVALPVKSMSNEYTLPEDTADPDILKAHILRLFGEVGMRLRQAGYLGKTVVVKFRYDDFITVMRSETVRDYIDSDRAIFQKAWELFTRHWVNWRKVRLVGVGITHLIQRKNCQRQLSLFDDNLKQARVDRTVDAIKAKFGENAIIRAGTMALKGKDTMSRHL